MPIHAKIKRCHPEAQLPYYATPGAAAMDIKPCNMPATGIILTNCPPHMYSPELRDIIAKGVPVYDTFVFDTGWACEIPYEKVLMVYSRSGHGFKYNVTLANGTGVIDSDYRGEVKVKLTANKNEWCHLKPSESIAQCMIVDAIKVVWDDVENLSETARNTGGFGSTNT